MNVLRALLSMLCLCLLAACGGGGGEASPPPASSPPPGGAATASVAVTVIDAQGRFVAGATVASPSGSDTSKASGVASLPVATGNEQLLTVTKAGFAEQVKLLTVPDGRSADALQVMLIERDAPVTINAIENGGSAGGRDGVKVTLPAGALVDGAGNAVTGAIQMQMTALDVTAIDAEAFPGAFEGVPSGGSRAAIMSYGTAELLPLQNGQKLQLASGKSAQIELPIYAAVHQDGSAVALGETIALWSLNAATGVWTQEGSGTVVANAASPSGRALRATISHFSWWNGDVSAQMGTVNLTVNVPNPNAPIAAGTLASVTGQVVAGSGPGWVAQASAPVGAVTALRVPSNATTRLAVRVDLPTQVCAGTTDVGPAPNATVDVTVSAVCVTVPVPTIVNPVSGTVTNSSGTLTVTTTIAGGQPDTLDVLVDGTLDPNQHLGFAQLFYRTPWNLAPLSEGTHTIVARATRQGVTRDSASVTIAIDRTAPQATAISPSASTEVNNSTEFDVDFSEPVFAGRPDLVLTDVIKLSVLPIGQATPVEIPITASFQNGQTRVHVSVNQALPLGTASLTWASLRDGAGNLAGNPIGQSWNVARTARLATSDALFSNSTFVMNTNSAGTVFTLHRRASDGNLVASQLGATGLAQIGPAVNDRTPGGDNNASIAADANGVPFVAFVQANAAGTAGEVVVKRFDANANAWLTLVAPFALTVAQNQSILPRLQLN
ncbi:MAG TPA: Ig-like domain-containing protein, partial [Burkholderiaceae bacterium]|nr:Ig-like domain-containing protein [Burkholderiaceae bacterium]